MEKAITSRDVAFPKQRPKKMDTAAGIGSSEALDVTLSS